MPTKSTINKTINNMQIEQLPFTFQLKHETTKSCGCKQSETVNYNLTVDFLLIEGEKRYRIYYTPQYCDRYELGKEPQRIGEATGLGETKDEAILEIQKILKTIL